MWSIKPTMAGKHLLMGGFCDDGGCDKRSHQLTVATIISSDQVTSHWEEMSSAFHYDTATVPYSNPPLIIGGCDINDVPTSDINLYDTAKKSWKQIDSLTAARSYVGVATINSDTLIIVGGNTKGGSVEAAMATSLPIVVIGHIVRY